MKQLFFVQGKFYGESPRTRATLGHTFENPKSYAFFCPVCAEVWARCPVVLDDDSSSPYMIWTRCCHKHSQHKSEASGSISMAWDAEFEAAFPTTLLQVEVEIALNHWAKSANYIES